MSLSKSESIIPRLSLLTDEQKGEFHKSSMEILSSTGIKVESNLAEKIFNKAGITINRDKKAFIPEGLINWAVKMAPSNFTLYKKTGEAAFEVGTKNVNNARYGIGVTNTHYQPPGKRKVEKFLRKHMTESTRLGDVLKGYDVISTVGIASDVPGRSSDLYNVLDMYANTDKPLVVLILQDNVISKVFDLLEYLHGDISKKPFILPYINPVTPLILNESTVEKMDASIKKGLPVIFSNYSMYGATTPFSTYGTVALLNAELLAGLVLSQLIKEGTPVMLGSLPAGFEMKTMVSTYTPRSYLMNIASAEMMEYYQIPHCGTSGSGNGLGADLIAAGNIWMNHLLSCFGKVGLAPFCGSNFDSLAFSPATAVLSDKIIRSVRNIVGGIKTDDMEDVLEEIINVGPGGNFLTSDSTIKNYRSEIDNDPVWPGMTLEKWMNEGNPGASDMLEEYTVNLLNKLKKPPGHDDIIQKGEKFINSLK